jgi:hypothetical protein
MVGTFRVTKENGAIVFINLAAIACVLFLSNTAEVVLLSGGVVTAGAATDKTVAAAEVASLKKLLEGHLD